MLGPPLFFLGTVMDFFIDKVSPHIEAIAAVVVTTAPLLLPSVNRTIARVTGNRYLSIAFNIADALKDGVQTDEVIAALGDLRKQNS